MNKELLLFVISWGELKLQNWNLPNQLFWRSKIVEMLYRSNGWEVSIYQQDNDKYELCFMEHNVVYFVLTVTISKEGDKLIATHLQYVFCPTSECIETKKLYFIASPDRLQISDLRKFMQSLAFVSEPFSEVFAWQTTWSSKQASIYSQIENLSVQRVRMNQKQKRAVFYVEEVPRYTYDFLTNELMVYFIEKKQLFSTYEQFLQLGMVFGKVSEVWGEKQEIVVELLDKITVPYQHLVKKYDFFIVPTNELHYLHRNLEKSMRISVFNSKQADLSYRNFVKQLLYPVYESFNVSPKIENTDHLLFSSTDDNVKKSLTDQVIDTFRKHDIPFTAIVSKESSERIPSVKKPINAMINNDHIKVEIRKFETLLEQAKKERQTIEILRNRIASHERQEQEMSAFIAELTEKETNYLEAVQNLQKDYNALHQTLTTIEEQLHELVDTEVFLQDSKGQQEENNAVQKDLYKQVDKKLKKLASQLEEFELKEMAYLEVYNSNKQLTKRQMDLKLLETKKMQYHQLLTKVEEAIHKVQDITNMTSREMVKHMDEIESYTQLFKLSTPSHELREKIEQIKKEQENLDFIKQDLPILEGFIKNVTQKLTNLNIRLSMDDIAPMQIGISELKIMHDSLNPKLDYMPKPKYLGIFKRELHEWQIDVTYYFNHIVAGYKYWQNELNRIQQNLFFSENQAIIFNLFDYLRSIRKELQTKKYYKTLEQLRETDMAIVELYSKKFHRENQIECKKKELQFIDEVPDIATYYEKRTAVEHQKKMLEIAITQQQQQMENTEQQLADITKQLHQLAVEMKKQEQQKRHTLIHLEPFEKKIAVAQKRLLQVEQQIRTKQNQLQVIPNLIQQLEEQVKEIIESKDQYGYLDDYEKLIPILQQMENLQTTPSNIWDIQSQVFTMEQLTPELVMSNVVYIENAEQFSQLEYQRIAKQAEVIVAHYHYPSLQQQNPYYPFILNGKHTSFITSAVQDKICDPMIREYLEVSFNFKKQSISPANHVISTKTIQTDEFFIWIEHAQPFELDKLTNSYLDEEAIRIAVEQLQQVNESIANRKLHKDLKRSFKLKVCLLMKEPAMIQSLFSQWLSEIENLEHLDISLASTAQPADIVLFLAAVDQQMTNDRLQAFQHEINLLMLNGQQCTVVIGSTNYLRAQTSSNLYGYLKKYNRIKKLQVGDEQKCSIKIRNKI